MGFTYYQETSNSRKEFRVLWDFAPRDPSVGLVFHAKVPIDSLWVGFDHIKGPKYHI